MGRKSKGGYQASYAASHSAAGANSNGGYGGRGLQRLPYGIRPDELIYCFSCGKNLLPNNFTNLQLTKWKQKKRPPTCNGCANGTSVSDNSWGNVPVRQNNRNQANASASASNDISDWSSPPASSSAVSAWDQEDSGDNWDDVSYSHSSVTSKVETSNGCSTTSVTKTLAASVSSTSYTNITTKGSSVTFVNNTAKQGYQTSDGRTFSSFGEHRAPGYRQVVNMGEYFQYPCYGCHRTLPRDGFSKAQRRRKEYALCIDCINEKLNTELEELEDLDRRGYAHDLEVDPSKLTKEARILRGMPDGKKKKKDSDDEVDALANDLNSMNISQYDQPESSTAAARRANTNAQARSTQATASRSDEKKEDKNDMGSFFFASTNASTQNALKKLYSGAEYGDMDSFNSYSLNDYGHDAPTSSRGKSKSRSGRTESHYSFADTSATLDGFDGYSTISRDATTVAGSIDDRSVISKDEYNDQSILSTTSQDKKKKKKKKKSKKQPETATIGKHTNYDTFAEKEEYNSQAPLVQVDDLANEFEELVSFR